MLARALTEYIINALWQIPLLAGGAWTDTLDYSLVCALVTRAGAEQVGYNY